MLSFTVTTAADVTSATDGLTSLREAVEAATAAKQAATITFDQALFSPNGPTLPPQLTLDRTLTIGPDASLVIDGSTRSLSFDVTITGSTRLMTVAAGATVTLRDLRMGGGRETGANGQDGETEIATPAATLGAPATRTTAATRGGDGRDGFDADPGTAGGLAVAGIVNAGILTLERVTLTNLDARGGTAGRGGIAANGADGGFGGPGLIGDPVEGPTGFTATATRLAAPASGGDGGDGGEGARGGDGGDAVGGILNTGRLTLRDVEFVNIVAIGGRAGQGGIPGRGGEGGSPGVDFGVAGAAPNNAGLTILDPLGIESSVFPTGGTGGNGGRGGDGGDGGDGRRALLNLGQVVIEGAQAGVSGGEGRGGLAGVGVSGGAGGGRGAIEGNDPRFAVTQFVYPSSRSGLPGSPGAGGVAGAPGAAGDFGGVAVSTTPDTFIVETVSETVREDDASPFITFEVRRLGDPAAARTVTYVITGSAGLTSDDFVAGPGLTTRLGGGQVTFAPTRTSDAGTRLVLRVAQDAVVEGDETVTFTITDVSGGGIGFSDSATVTIASQGPGPGAGPDTLPGGPGPDRLEGGGGDDLYLVNDPGDRLVEARGAGRDEAQASVSFALPAHVEALTLTGARPIAGTGNDLGNVILGNGAANVLDGRGGPDRIDGRGGADRLIGGAGDDTLIGGTGTDTADYRGAAAVRVSLAATGAQNTLGAGRDRLSGVENLTGGDGGDRLTGDGGRNALAGGAGADALTGAGGADLLTGGAGRDRFVFVLPGESAPGAPDRIAGFDRPGAGPGDLVDLSAIDANLLLDGEQDFAFGAATGAGRLYVRADGATTVLRGNIDADAAPEIEIVIDDGSVAPGRYALADFVL